MVDMKLNLHYSEALRNGLLKQCAKIMWSGVMRFFFSFFFRATFVAFGRSWAKGPIRAAAASVPHSHSNNGPEPNLRPTLQLAAMPDS